MIALQSAVTVKCVDDVWRIVSGGMRLRAALQLQGQAIVRDVDTQTDVVVIDRDGTWMIDGRLLLDDAKPTLH